jgi:hypothetical protein
MNLQQIRKNLGQNLHLRPIPHRVGDAGQRLLMLKAHWPPRAAPVYQPFLPWTSMRGIGNRRLCFFKQSRSAG